jgi:hypothetical protein
MRSALSLVLVLSVACQASEENKNRHTAEEDQVSFAIPDGFRLRRDRDTWVLVGQQARSRSTIGVRSVPRDGWSEDRSPDSVLPATELVLRDLPGAEVTGPVKLSHPAYPAFAFDVVFEPRSRRGERYRRRHVVLFGESRVFHVLATSPDKQSQALKAAFERVLETVREEG